MELTRCFACMQELDSPGGVCRHCGFDNTKGLSGQPAHALPCGSVLAGHYLVGKVLGQGGFGITYIGWNLSLEMPVCIKEYFPAGAAMRSASQSSCVLWGGGESAAELKRGRESFVKEARKAVKLSDLGSVVKVWDVFYENETAYIVMNYLEGETLKSWLVKRGKPLDEKSCFAFLEPVMRELDEVHKRGIIHRDIKPDNLMLRSDGKLVLLDLGAAKDLSGGSGQSSYMVASQGFSPMEQYRAHGEIGPWTDVYAMCATFYYCVSGKLPPTPMDRAEGVKPDMDAFSPAVAAVLGKGLALHSKDRIQSMSELSSLLHEALQFSSRTVSKPAPAAANTSVTPKPVQPKPVPARRGSKLPLIFGLLLLALMLVFSGVKYMQTRSPAVTASPTEAPAVEAATPTLEPAAVPTLEPTPSQTPKPLPTQMPEPAPIVIPEPTQTPAAEPLRITDITAGAAHTVALYSDGTVASTMITGGEPFYDKGQTRVSDWRDIVAVDTGGYHTVGLRSDGTVVAVGSNDYGQCEVSGWRDVVAIAAGNCHTVGLRSDGTVVATEITGEQYYNYGQSEVSDWRDIVAVYAGGFHTLSQRSDGTLVAAGKDWDGQDKVSDWRDMKQLAADNRMALGLRSDGTILALGSDYYGQFEAARWSGITAISTNGNHTVGLKTDGTVVAVGRNDLGQCEVSNWRDITAVSVGAFHTAGLRADGTVVVVGRNIEGQCDVDTLNAPVLAAQAGKAGTASERMAA